MYGVQPRNFHRDISLFSALEEAGGREQEFEEGNGLTNLFRSHKVIVLDRATGQYEAMDKPGLLARIFATIFRYNVYGGQKELVRSATILREANAAVLHYAPTAAGTNGSGFVDYKQRNGNTQARLEKVLLALEIMQEEVDGTPIAAFTHIRGDIAALQRPASVGEVEATAAVAVGSAVESDGSVTDEEGDELDAPLLPPLERRDSPLPPLDLPTGEEFMAMLEARRDAGIAATSRADEAASARRKAERALPPPPPSLANPQQAGTPRPPLAPPVMRTGHATGAEWLSRLPAHLDLPGIAVDEADAFTRRFGGDVPRATTVY